MPYPAAELLRVVVDELAAVNEFDAATALGSSSTSRRGAAACTGCCVVRQLPSGKGARRSDLVCRTPMRARTALTRFARAI